MESDIDNEIKQEVDCKENSPSEMNSNKNNNNDIHNSTCPKFESHAPQKSEPSHDDSAEIATPSTTSSSPPLPPQQEKRYSYMRCLFRVGGDSHLRHIPLETGTDYWVGRLHSNNIHIDDGMLSRKHAEIKVGKTGAWTVADNKSANGTYVTPRHGEQRRLDPMKPHKLEDLDLVQFGVERPGAGEAPFRWRFHLALKFAANSNLPPKSLVDSTGRPLSPTVAGIKRACEEDEDDATASSSSSSASAAKRSRLSSGLDEQLTNYRQQLEQMQRELKRKEEEKERVKREMEEEAKSKVEAAQEQMVRQIEEEKNRFAGELKGK